MCTRWMRYASVTRETNKKIILIQTMAKTRLFFFWRKNEENVFTHERQTVIIIAKEKPLNNQKYYLKKNG